MLKQFFRTSLFILFTVLMTHTGLANQDTGIKKFKLLTMLYNEKNPKRAQEYITCLEKNLAHDRIDTIHVFYDTSNDDENNTILKYLLSKDVVITYIEGRATYQDFFNLVNEQYPNCRIIVSNADIYYNNTLNLLDTYNLTGKFLAITRWDVHSDNSVQPFGLPFGSYSQDTWIFETPIKKFKNANIPLGTPGCDNKIAYQASKGRLRVINPCKTIQCCHVHASGIRHVKIKDLLTNGVITALGIKSRRVPWCRLETKNVRNWKRILRKHCRHCPKRRKYIIR